MCVLFFGHFTNDNIKDIFININSGGSDGFTTNEIYSFNTNENLYENIFTNKDYLKNIEVKYKDYYKVVATSSTDVKVFDISDKSDEYLKKLYFDNGQLKEETTGLANLVSNCYPYDMDFNGVYEVLLRQKITGLNNSDIIGYLDTYYRYENGKFIEIK